MTPPSQGAAHGLIIGEALSWTGLYDRSYLLPFWTRRKRREIETQYERDSLIELSLPFTLNQPTDALLPGPGLHTEWFAFEVQIVRGSGRYSQEAALAAWQDLTRHTDLRVTISQRAALENLTRGKRPPVSGHDNPHYFDDSACFRALPLATLGTANLTAQVRSDAVITNALDGIWAAQAYASAVAGMVETGAVRTSLRQALQYLPTDSWIGQAMTTAMHVCQTAQSIFDLVSELSSELVNYAYNFGNSAAETLPITFAIVDFTEGNLQQSLMAALALPKVAGSVAPLVGALCGTLDPEAATQANVFGTQLRGISLPVLKGLDVIDLLTASPKDC